MLIRILLSHTLKIVLCAVVAFLFFPLIGVQAQSPINVIVNGRAVVMDAAPVVRNGITFVPIRAVSNALGLRVYWWPEHNIASIGNGINFLSFQIGFTTVSFTNHKKEHFWLEAGTALFLINGRMFVPLRMLAETMGLTVGWNLNTRTITLSTSSPTSPVKGTSYLPARQPSTERRKMSPEEIIALAEPATVQIWANSVNGSGFFISPNGLVVTNAHVVRGNPNLYIVMRNGERLPARILKINNVSDLALLAADSPSERVFPYIKHRAYHNTVFVGDAVIAFGNPGGREWFISHGVVDSIRDMVLDTAWTKKYPLITHTAYTDSGSSGGLLVNLYGEWIGTHALSGVDQELGFAVPTDFLYELLELEYFRLNCDWEGYWTDSSTWKRELKRAREAFETGINALQGSQAQADAWRKAVAIAENTRVLARFFKPSFPELHHLPILFKAKTDALIAYYSFHANSAINNSIRTHEEYIRLWAAVERAAAEYNTEFQRVSSLVSNQNKYKAVMP